MNLCVNICFSKHNLKIAQLAVNHRVLAMFSDKWSSCLLPQTNLMADERSPTEIKREHVGGSKVWQTMLADFPQQLRHPRIATINAMRCDFTSIDFLAAVIDGISFIDDARKCNVTLKLIDPSGELYALVPKELYNAHVRHLLPQNAIVLRHCRLLPKPPMSQCQQRYVLVTAANLSDVYVKQADTDGAVGRLSFSDVSTSGGCAKKRAAWFDDELDDDDLAAFDFETAQDGAAPPPAKHAKAAPSSGVADKENRDAADVRDILSDVDLAQFLDDF